MSHTEQVSGKDFIRWALDLALPCSHVLWAQRCTTWHRWLRLWQKHTPLVCSNGRSFRSTYPKDGWKSFPCETFGMLGARHSGQERSKSMPFCRAHVSTLQYPKQVEYFLFLEASHGTLLQLLGGLWYPWPSILSYVW